MAIAILVNLIQIAFGTMRWREISGHCHAPLDLVQAFRYNMIGTFFNQTPLSTIGGDAVRLRLVSHSAGWRSATYSVLVDRAIGLIALAVLVVFSLPWSFELTHNDRGRLALVDVSAIGDWAPCSSALCRGDGSKPGGQPITFHACSVITNQVIFNRTTSPRIAVLSIAIHVLTIVIAWCAVRVIFSAC